MKENMSRLMKILREDKKLYVSGIGTACVCDYVYLFLV